MAVPAAKSSGYCVQPWSITTSGTGSPLIAARDVELVGPGSRGIGLGPLEPLPHRRRHGLRRDRTPGLCGPSVPAGRQDGVATQRGSQPRFGGTGGCCDGRCRIGSNLERHVDQPRFARVVRAVPGRSLRAPQPPLDQRRRLGQPSRPRESASPRPSKCPCRRSLQRSPYENGLGGREPPANTSALPLI